MNWILRRLNEPSTWRGIVAILTAFGMTITPEMAEKIVALGLALIGIINLIRTENAEPKPLPWKIGKQPTKEE